MCTVAAAMPYSWSLGSDDEVATQRFQQVLLADDDDDFRDLLAAALRRRGYVVTPVRDGFEFVEFVASATVDGTDLPDVIVTDLKMPGLSGLQLMRVLRDCGWPMPVILVSGFADDDVRTRAEGDAFAVLAKPCSMELIARAVDLAAGTPIR